MGSFYSTYFPEGMHKLKLPDVKQAEDYLERAFSDDVSITVFLPMVEEEEFNPTFETLQTGTNLMVKKRQIS